MTFSKILGKKLSPSGKMKGGKKNLLKSQVYQNDQRPLKRTEKMFPRKKIFFVRAALPSPPPTL